MVFLKLNGFEFVVKEEISVLEACKFVGIKIPRFCYHETLSIAGNCRMCLVRTVKPEITFETNYVDKNVDFEYLKTVNPLIKPTSFNKEVILENSEEDKEDLFIISCLTPVQSNMSIVSNDPIIRKVREEILEFLLLNHPLDCPICDQGGECDLQDQTKNFGSNRSKFIFNKVGVEDKDFGFFIKSVMTRCIHCTRCVRFSSEIAGFDSFGVLNRGGHTEIGMYSNYSTFNSEISGNVIDLCPVGALTSKPYTFKARPWELKSIETIDLTDSVGSNIYSHFSDSEIFRVIIVLFLTKLDLSMIFAIQKNLKLL
jgi:NADH dehydrogenase/NADH:ubiquinone oxidoreductase subunit G